MSPQRLTDADVQAIEAAAREAEERTSGEIVTYIVGRCDDYDEASWKGAAFGALAITAAAALLFSWHGGWGTSVELWMVLPPLIGASVGYLLASWSSAVTRWLMPDDVIEHRVRMRAETAFLDEEVFLTEERTGVLLFLALFEHRALVLGDAGINAKVEAEEWQTIADDLATGVGAERTSEALVEAIDRCGELLERRGVERRLDDIDEISNKPRIRDR